MTLLEVRGADVHYGDFQALYGIDLAVSQGETLAVIGANGAGKTTLLKTIAGLQRTTRGTVHLAGADIGALAPHRRVGRGIALTPEGRRVFPSLTVEENLRVGAYRSSTGPWHLDAVYQLFPLLAARRTARGVTLSGGEQQALAIGRALMSNPRLLLLDEVSLGLAPVVVEQLYRALSAVAAEGTTLLLVEQDVRAAMRVADRVQCLLEGRTVLAGHAGSLTHDQVANAYFGV